MAHVKHNTGKYEWYTPPEYLEAARKVLGTIDLDPASCEYANQFVQAQKYYDKESNGLQQEWFGKVWMNPPYSTQLLPKFCAKLVQSYKAGHVQEAIVLVNNATDTKWFNLLLLDAKALIFVLGRIRFITSDTHVKGKPLQGQAFLYFGDNADAFMREFKPFGWGGVIK